MDKTKISLCYVNLPDFIIYIHRLPTLKRGLQICIYLFSA